jgi:hypothetical protein
MNSRLFAIAVLAVWIPLVPATAQTAGAFEPFTYQTNANSWFVYDYADEEYYFPRWDLAEDGLNPDIYFTFAGSDALEFSADSTTSGGVFVGDLAAGGVDAVGCEIFIEDVSSFDVAEFFLFSAATNRYYTSEFVVPEASGWNAAYTSLTRDTWYVFENGAYVPILLTPEILGGITAVGLTFYPQDVPAADGKAVGIDQFTFYGALVLPEVTSSASAGSFQLTFDRRPGIGYSIQSAPDLASWTLVAGEEFITGTSPYTMTKPLAPGPRFFKVGIEDFLTPVPELTGP